MSLEEALNEMASLSATRRINEENEKQMIIASLTSMKNSIEYDIQIGYQLESELNKELGQITAKTECITFATDFGDSKNGSSSVHRNQEL